MSGAGVELVLDRFSLHDTVVNTSARPNIEIYDQANVTLRNGTVSSEGTAEISASWYTTLVVENVRVIPKHPRTFGFILQYSSSADLKGIVYNATFVSGIPERYGFPIQVHGGWFNLFDSVIDAGEFYSNYDVPLVYASSTDVVMEGNTIICTAATNFVRINGAGNVEIEDNWFKDGTLNGNGLQMQGSYMAIRNNVFSNVTSPTPYSIISINAMHASLLQNRLENCSAFSAVGLESLYTLENATGNDIVGGSLEYFLSTSTRYDSVADGIYSIGPNYWNGLSDFQQVRRKMYDSLYDIKLVSITFVDMYLEQRMGNYVLDPSLASIVDLNLGTVAGTIFKEGIVLVPKGVYYSPNNIIVQHANATLVLEPGVRIMFAPNAGIRIGQGSLAVLGSAQEPVELSSTDRLAGEYNKTTVEMNNTWVGIWFGGQAHGTSLLDGEYIDGSFIRHCNIYNAGYSPGVVPASLFLQISVMIRSVSVHNSGADGLQVIASMNEISLSDVQIIGSQGFGAYFVDCGNVLFSNSEFDGNYLSSPDGAQIRVEGLSALTLSGW